MHAQLYIYTYPHYIYAHIHTYTYLYTCKAGKKKTIRLTKKNLGRERLNKGCKEINTN